VSTNIELDPVARLTAAAVGEPGARVFYLQARKDDVVVSVVLEKQQLALLAMHIDQLLERIGTPDEATAPDPDSLDLEQPITPEFRVGAIGLAYEDERDLVVLQCDEYVPDPDEDDPEEILVQPDPGRVRIWATREQMFGLARRGEREVAGGRPICPMCGEPMDPDGHFCARSNGHREIDRLG
jgi:uncharacterized repeat protein (TIGR03847 family)